MKFKFFFIISIFLMGTSLSTVNAHATNNQDELTEISDPVYIEAHRLLEQGLMTQDTDEQQVLLSEAASMFTEVLDKFPGSINAYIARGIIYDKLGQPNRAVDDYTTALSISPNNFIALQNRAFAYEQLGKAYEAKSDLSQAQKLHAQMTSYASTEAQQSGVTNGTTYGEWFGQINTHNYSSGGVTVPNAPGWACGPTSGKSNVENAVWFALRNSVSNRGAWEYVFYYNTGQFLWQSAPFGHYYASATGWTTPSGYNYYLLIPERNVCIGYGQSPSNFKITGTY